jgi:hypothetical protein
MGTSPLPPYNTNVVSWGTDIRLVKDQILDHHCATNKAIKEVACLLNWRSTEKESFGFSKDGGWVGNFVVK